MAAAETHSLLPDTSVRYPLGTTARSRVVLVVRLGKRPPIRRCSARRMTIKEELKTKRDDEIFDALADASLSLLFLLWMYQINRETCESIKECVSFILDEKKQRERER